MKRSGGLQPGPWGAGFAWLYGAVVLARRRAYDRSWLAIAPSPCFTVSVGGLEAGGVGKTPIAALLLNAYLHAGRRPGLLTRGYGRGSSRLVLRRHGEPALSQSLGDEAAMLVQAGLDLPVAACGTRSIGAQALVECGCDVIVLDDGFAHRALARDVDIVVLRGEAPLASGHLLPWGSLREPPSSLRRAHVVWLHFAEHVVSPPAWLEQLAPQASVVVSEARPVAARSLADEPVDLHGRRVVAAAGIANPQRFFAALARMGARLDESCSLPDHHLWQPADVEALAALVRSHGSDGLVVTPKDAIKLAALWQGPPLWVVGTQVRVLAGRAELAKRLRMEPQELAAAEAEQ